MDPVMKIDLIPALTNNYIFALSNDQGVIVFDPGDATPVGDYLAREQRHLTAIVITHHHHDHINGAAILRLHYHCPVYAPRAEQALIQPITPVDHWLDDGHILSLLGLEFQVIATPGHSVGHLSYYLPPLTPDEPGQLFCGDALFVLGCGRISTGLEQNWADSLRRLRDLPDNTYLFSGHEYALSNLRFALVVDGDNPALQERAAIIQALRQQHQATVPSLLGDEKATNPFLRAEKILTDMSWPAAPIMMRRQKDVF